MDGGCRDGHGQPILGQPQKPPFPRLHHVVDVVLSLLRGDVFLTFEPFQELKLKILFAMNPHRLLRTPAVTLKEFETRNPRNNRPDSRHVLSTARAAMCRSEMLRLVSDALLILFNPSPLIFRWVEVPVASAV